MDAETAVFSNRFSFLQDLERRDGGLLSCIIWCFPTKINRLVAIDAISEFDSHWPLFPRSARELYITTIYNGCC